jgi:site-specific DNA recombinase
MNGVAMSIAIYLRVSTDEQRERQSIETQREELERFCRLQSLHVAETYADDGLTGTIPVNLRPAGGRMLRDARAKKFDRVLVYKLDRLGRDTMVTLEAVAELAKCGVRVVSITEACDGETSGGRLMLTIHSAFAAHEREVIRERSLAGTNRVAQSGAWLGGVVPFGYRKVGQKMAARLVISDDPIPDVGLSEAEIIRMIYRMAAKEGKSCFHISDQLNQLAVPCSYVRDEKLVTRGKRKTRTSGLWRPGRVRNMLVKPPTWASTSTASAPGIPIGS